MATSNGVNLEGFSNTGEQSGSNTIDGNYSPATGFNVGAGLSWPAAQDKSTQGNAGFNAEGSYESGIRKETNAYPESENM